MKHCKKVLVVEDCDDIRASITEALELEGFRVESACNGREALEALRGFDEPALILLDLMMPVMNGWEFLDQQKVDPRLAQHRVVTISAIEPTESLRDRTPLETHGAIRKPLTLEGIWSEVHKHCSPDRPAA